MAPPPLPLFFNVEEEELFVWSRAYGLNIDKKGLLTKGTALTLNLKSSLVEGWAFIALEG